MALYNDKSMADIVNKLDIVDRTGKDFVAQNALTQRRKNLGEDAKLPEWNGLSFLVHQIPNIHKSEWYARWN